ncbi:glycosyltransferase [Colwelliaceae bacterium 6441]
MKIIFMLENYDMGGVEKVSLQLLKGIKLLAPEICVSILTEQDKGELKAEFNQTYPCQCLNGRNNFRIFKNKIEELQPDLIVFTKGGLSKYKLSILFNEHIKTIAIQHVPIDLPDSSTLKNTIRKISAAFLYRLVSKVICVSDGIANNLKSTIKLNDKQVGRIYNPVIDQQISPLSQETVEYSNYFVCVGRIHYQKGYDLLLNIIQQAKVKDNNIQVVIIGDGPDRQMLEESIKEKELNDNVIIHGFTDNPYKYIRAAKGILMTSRWEGLPTVLVEAAYLKTQIISFDCRYGPSELTSKGRNGYLINENNEKDFVTAIEKVNSGKIKELPQLTDFHLKSAAKNYLSLFREVS